MCFGIVRPYRQRTIEARERRIDLTQRQLNDSEKMLGVKGLPPGAEQLLAELPGICDPSCLERHQSAFEQLPLSKWAVDHVMNSHFLASGSPSVCLERVYRASTT